MLETRPDFQSTSEALVCRAIDILDTLIAFDTTSAGSNLALIDHVERYLASHGVRATRVANVDGTKANLIATIGPAIDGGIVLSSHTDVVPVADQRWSSDPFVLVERDGRFFGRGTSDMKGFLALALAAVPHLVAGRQTRPVHLAFSYDEEVGCLGAPDLIQRLMADGPRPSVAIIGEPTEMRIVNSHKSIHLYEVVVTGREAHSSLAHEGVSANMVAIDLMAVLVGIAKTEQAEHRDDRFDPAWSTLTVGLINGGTAANILAGECRFTFDLRSIPSRDPEIVLAPFMAAVAAADARLAPWGGGAGVAIRRSAAVPALCREEDGAAEQLATMLSGSNEPGDAVSYGAEAGQFQAAGLSTIICGPGSIQQAHRADEFIERSQMEAGARFMARLIELVTARGMPPAE